MKIIDEQNEKENFLRILRLAQSGKSTKEPKEISLCSTPNSTKTEKKKFENVQYSKKTSTKIQEPRIPSTTIPYVPLMPFRSKKNIVIKPQCIRSVEEFPPL